MERAGIELVTGQLSKVTLQSTLIERIREGHNVDTKLSDLKQEVQTGNAKDFTMSDTGLIKFKGRYNMVSNSRGVFVCQTVLN